MEQTHNFIKFEVETVSCFCILGSSNCHTAGRDGVTLLARMTDTNYQWGNGCCYWNSEDFMGVPISSLMSNRPCQWYTKGN